jgi:hypothetical protein
LGADSGVLVAIVWSVCSWDAVEDVAEKDKEDFCNRCGDDVKGGYNPCASCDRVVCLGKECALEVGTRQAIMIQRLTAHRHMHRTHTHAVLVSTFSLAVARPVAVTERLPWTTPERSVRYN